MEYRPLKITVISAEGIKDMNRFSKQDVYVVASLAGYPASQKKTPVHTDGGTKPKWNFQMEFIVDEPYLTKPGMSLVFQIFAESSIRSDKEIGTVTVPVDELFKTNSSNDQKCVEYQVMTEGKAKGTLKFSFSFGEKFSPPAPEAQKNIDHAVTAYPAKNFGGEPATAYPPAGYPGMGYPPGPPQYAAPPTAAYGAYPPQPSGYGYPPHGQPSGYGYQQPPPPGYGYPGAMPGYAGKPQKPKKGKMGMGAGLGLGLGAGLLGGLLVGEMADGIGDAAAYADGYGDAMGDMGDMGGDFDF